MKKLLLVLALLAANVHAETNWTKVTSKPNQDGTISEVLLLADNMTCLGVNYVKFSNLYNEKNQKHFDYIQAFQFGIYRSKDDTQVLMQPGPTTDFIEHDTTTVLATGVKTLGKKEVVYPKTLMGDIFNITCKKELMGENTRKEDI